MARENEETNKEQILDYVTRSCAIAYTPMYPSHKRKIKRNNAFFLKRSLHGRVVWDTCPFMVSLKVHAYVKLRNTLVYDHYGTHEDARSQHDHVHVT